MPDQGYAISSQLPAPPAAPSSMTPKAPVRPGALAPTFPTPAQPLAVSEPVQAAPHQAIPTQTVAIPNPVPQTNGWQQPQPQPSYAPPQGTPPFQPVGPSLGQEFVPPQNLHQAPSHLQVGQPEYFPPSAYSLPAYATETQTGDTGNNIVMAYVFAAISLLFFPIVFGPLAIYFANKAKAAGHPNGGTARVIAIVAMLIGLTLGAVLALSMRAT